MMVNRFKSNGGSEFEDEGELNYTTTFYRKYDAQIGRFTGIDMYAEKFAVINPYQFGANNPVLFSDPSGALMTTEQFKQVRDYNHLDMEKKLGGDWQDFGTSSWNSWDNPMDGPWGAGGGGDGGSDGDGGSGGTEDKDGSLHFTGQAAQGFLGGLQSAAANANEDGEWSLSPKLSKSGDWGYYSSSNYETGDYGNGHRDLPEVGIMLKWISFGNIGPGPWYASKDAAAIGWYKTYYNSFKIIASSAKGLEWSSEIYSVRGKNGKKFYSFSEPVQWGSDNSSPGVGNPLHILPKGAVVEGFAHNHLLKEGLTGSNEFFSKGPNYDQGMWSNSTVDWYLFTKNGNFRVARKNTNVMDIMLATRGWDKLIHPEWKNIERETRDLSPVKFEP